MTEAQLNTAFCEMFKTWFDVSTEVHPIGSSRRVDVLLSLKADRRYSYAVELKRPDHKQGTQIEAWLKQANDYSKMKYKVDGENRTLPVLIYPALSSLFIQKDFEHEPILKDGFKYYRPKHHEFHEHSNVNIFTAMVGLGEIRKTDWNGRIGYAFIYRNQILWHEHAKPQQHKKNYSKYFDIYSF